MPHFKNDRRYTVQEVLDHVWPAGPKISFDGDKMKVSSSRLLMFAEKGICCVTCGIEGAFFLKEKSSVTQKQEPWHFNLYAEKDGFLVLMTKDHIKPKSKGGKNHPTNYQPMCAACNAKKADTFPV
jgi:hypothetical protein